MATPLVLDFDGSVLPLPGEARLPLRHRQEAVRFGCRRATLDALAQELGGALDDGRPLFLGSGDFHHLSFLRLRRMARADRPLRVVVLDNHPDNMRYPFGIHCGSWVSHAARLPGITRIDVLGIASGDVDGLHALENRLAALRAGRVHYWCLGREARLLLRLGAAGVRSFAAPAELLAAFAATLDDAALYLSIDKDVLGPDVVRTNWDQGRFTLADLEAAIAATAPRLVGCDIVGDVSHYRYRSRFKRLLAAIDGQAPPPAGELAAWQRRQQTINLRILDRLENAR